MVLDYLPDVANFLRKCTGKKYVLLLDFQDLDGECEARIVQQENSFVNLDGQHLFQ